MGLREWFNNKLDDVADKVQDFSGESERRVLVDETKDATTALKQDVTHNVETLNEMAVQFNSRVDKLNHIREEAIAELVGQLREHMSRFGRVKAHFEFVPESYRRSELRIPERRLQTEEDYIASYDWDEQERFDFAFDRGVFGTKKETEKIIVDLTKHLDNLKLLREQIANEFVLKVDRRNLEISIAQTYLDIIDVIISQIEGVILPKLSIIKGFMIAKHVALYEEQIGEAELKNVNYSADALRGTDFEEYGVFIRNAFGFYILSANVLSNAVLTHLLEDTVTAEDEAALANQVSAVDSQARALKGEY